MDPLMELEHRLRSRQTEVPPAMRERVMRAVDVELSAAELAPRRRRFSIGGWAAAAALLLIVVNLSFSSASANAFSFSSEQAVSPTSELQVIHRIQSELSSHGLPARDD